MKPRHAAALALVVWYLLAPPKLDGFLVIEPTLCAARSRWSTPSSSWPAS